MTRVLTLSWGPHVIIISCSSYRRPGVIITKPLIGQSLTILFSHWLSLVTRCWWPNPPHQVSHSFTTVSCVHNCYKASHWSEGLSSGLSLVRSGQTDMFLHPALPSTLPGIILRDSGEPIRGQYWQILTNQRPSRWENREIKHEKSSCVQMSLHQRVIWSLTEFFSSNGLSTDIEAPLTAL